MGRYSRWILWSLSYGGSLAAILLSLSVYRHRVLVAYERGPNLAASWDRWQEDRAATGAGRPFDGQEKIVNTGTSAVGLGRPTSVNTKWTRPPATVWFGAGFTRLLLMATGLWTVIFGMLAFAVHGIVFGGPPMPASSPVPGHHPAPGKRESGDALG